VLPLDPPIQSPTLHLTTSRPKWENQTQHIDILESLH
jgi:hypothetical protein